MVTEGKPTTEPAAAPTPTPVASSFVLEEAPFSNAWYWTTLVIALASLFVLWLYYDGALALWIKVIYWVSTVLALILLVWSTGGLLRGYNVASRMAVSSRRRAERRRTSEAEEETEQIVYRENIVVRLFRFVGHLIALLFLFVWNTFLRLVYIAEYLVLSSIILAYDLIYYVLYAAWALTYYAVRLAWRITYWALRVAWRILRILTKFPIANWLWTKKMRPAILSGWNRRVLEFNERHARRLDQGRRLAAAKGLDPDQWERDRRLRHHFPLPHPHEARKGLRARIENRRKEDFLRRDRWRAFRKGLPMPPKPHKPGREPPAEESEGGKRAKRPKRREEKRGSQKESRGEPSSPVPPSPLEKARPAWSDE